MSDPGSGEKAIPAAELLSASVGYSVSSSVSLWLSASNLLDEEYFRSADRKAPLASGRSVALRFTWRSAPAEP